MFRRGCLPLLLIGILLLALAGAGRSAAYRAGWSQGYYAGQQVDREDGPPAAPYAPYAPGGWQHGPGFGFWPFLCGLGFFLKVGLFLLFFGMIARFFFGRRHWHGHKHFSGWHGQWPHHGHDMGKAPWAAEGDEPLDETIRKA